MTHKPVKPIALILFVMTMGIILSACDTETPEQLAEKDRKEIIEYLKEHDMYDEAKEDPSGVFYVIEKEGSGSYPNNNSIAKVTYHGYLLDGEMFDNRIESTMRLNNQIRGMQIGLTFFQRGSEGWILIPSGLGYGEYGTVGIPRNANLAFEVEMIDFN
ncbi:MAG: FKBP-type peptidyl-prolyl cis-trans isomerase [Bacteroidales bacterium]